ncbi:MAG: pseudouridine synthase [Prevotella sp.]
MNNRKSLNDNTANARPTVLHIMESDMEPPAKFTWPFFYTPHPLCRLAAAEVQKYLSSVGEWQEEISRGKMFGVLVVALGDGRKAFLAAYSGLLCGRNDLPWFVPAVFDSQQPDGYFKTHEAEISAINTEIEALETSDDYILLCRSLEDARLCAEREVNDYKLKMAEAKRHRDALRQESGNSVQLIAESQFMKAELRRLKQRHRSLTCEAEERLAAMKSIIDGMKEKRHRLSDDLQNWLFRQYKVNNANGRQRSIADIFQEQTGHIPPAGAGDCCAPKLLQYAYSHGLKPLCMAEFWWGDSPAGEIRQHGNYYPACRGKCKPILGFMLEGLETDSNPLADDENIMPETVYEDDYIIVVNKPAGMLSVPGKDGRRSVLSVLRNRWHDEANPGIVHRLDMDTSGLLVVAKTAAAYHNLQNQFAAHTVRKRYTALLEHKPSSCSGTVALPLLPDISDRPRQKVDMVNGKNAVTEYRITGVESDGKARAELLPLTGRTHQLRVHCAHSLGLGSPIVGDNLYGTPDRRLFLHAERLEFDHPATDRRMIFERKADF